MKITQEEYRKAYLIWKEENPEKENVPVSTVIELPSGRSVPLGQKIAIMKIIYKAMQEGKHYKSYRDLTEDEISWWKEHGVDLGEIKRENYTEEEYREAYLIWKKENLEKETVPRTTVIELSNGKKVPLGTRIAKMKKIYKAMQEGKHYRIYGKLTEEQIAWWIEHGVDLSEIKRVFCTEEEYREAYLLWKKENPKKENIPQSTIVILPGGKKVPLGNRISTMKSIYTAMQKGEHYGKYNDLTEDEIAWWKEHGVDLSEKRRTPYTEEEYREAYLLWKKENPEVKSVPYSTIVILPSGKKIMLGNRINTMKLIYHAMEKGEHHNEYNDLTKEQISWWKEHGIDLSERQKKTYTEEEYRKAYLIWKKENPKKRNVLKSTVVTLENGRKIPIGKRIPTMKLIYKAMQEGKHYQSNRDLTKEQIAWWKEHGVDLSEVLVKKEEDYQEAYLIWKKENPEKEHVPSSTVIELPNGKEIHLGHRIAVMRHIYQAMQEGKHYQNHRDLTEDEIVWWTEHGVNLEKGLRRICSEEEYREAYLIWKKKNPTKEDVPCSAVIKLPSGSEVPIGQRIAVIRSIYQAMQEGKHYQNHRELTEEQIVWWTEHGVNLGKKIVCSEADYREAYLIWREQNPRQESVPQVTVIELSNGKKVPLGTRISIMKLIYYAMAEGKHYGKYADLTEEQIAWWEEHGLSFEKSRKTWTIKNILEEFNIDFDQLIKSLENVKEKEKKVEFSEKTEGKTLKSFCRDSGYNFDITLKAVKLHKFFPNDTLEQLINRLMISNQNKKGIPSWIYDVYGDFIIQILLELNLNANRILTDMSNDIIPLEESICNWIFSRMCKKLEWNWLKSFYKTVIKKINFQETEEENSEMIVQELIKISEQNHLEDDEKEILKNCLFEYLRVIRKYQVMDVSLEEDPNKNQEKIKKYNLMEEEIAMMKKTQNEMNTSFKKMVYC